MGVGRFWILSTALTEITLSLSGGAARGAFHLGVLDALDEMGIAIRAIAGSSIGAAVGAGYASGVSPKKMLDIFKSRDFRRTISLNLHRGSLWRINTNENIFDLLLNGKKSFEALEFPLHVGITDLTNGKASYINSGELEQAISASYALLPFFAPVKIGKNWCADGGYMDNLPIKPLLEYGLPIVGVNLHPLLRHEKGSLLRRALFLSWHASIASHLNDLEYCISSPALDGYSLFNLSKLDELYELGYEESMNYFKTLQSTCSPQCGDGQK